MIAATLNMRRRRLLPARRRQPYPACQGRNAIHDHGLGDLMTPPRYMNGQFSAITDGPVMIGHMAAGETRATVTDCGPEPPPASVTRCASCRAGTRRYRLPGFGLVVLVAHEDSCPELALFSEAWEDGEI